MNDPLEANRRADLLVATKTKRHCGRVRDNSSRTGATPIRAGPSSSQTVLGQVDRASSPRRSVTPGHGCVEKRLNHRTHLIRLLALLRPCCANRADCFLTDMSGAPVLFDRFED